MARFRFMQWMVEVNEGTGAYNIYNYGSNGERQSHEVVPGKQGEPIIVAEPDLAFDPPVNLRYVNARGEEVRPNQKIASIICKDGPRLSLTDAKLKGIKIKVNDDGSVQVGEDKWWISTLFLKDKNLFRNYDAVCYREPMGDIDILDIGDIVDMF